MDIDMYVAQRLNALVQKKKLKKLRTSDNKIIAGLATNFNIPLSEDPKEMLDRLVNVVPLTWIAESTEHNEESESLMEYSNENGMIMLRKLHHKQELTDTEMQLLSAITAELKLTPVTDMQFTVFRGINQDLSTIIPGEIILSNGPSSATFSAQIAADYIGNECCMTEILIPKGSNVTYVDLLDQLIFPPKSSFRIVSKPFNKSWYMENNKSYTDILTIKMELV